MNSLHHLAVVADRVSPLHSSEDFVAPRLRRDVEIAADLRQIADGLKQVQRHVLRVVRDEFDSLDSVCVVNQLEQICKSVFFAVFDVPIAVDRLAEKSDLLHALSGERSDFGGDLTGRAALFRSACHRDDAVGTELVAANHDPHKGLVRRRPHLRIPQRIVALKTAGDLSPRTVPATEADGQLTLAFLSRLIDKARDLSKLSGADDDVNVRCPLKNDLLIFLSHAAHHADHQIRPLSLAVLDPSKLAVNLVLGMLAHAACVEEDRIRRADVVGEFVVPAPHCSHDELTVEHVHLTADSLNVELVVVVSGFRQRFRIQERVHGKPRESRGARPEENLLPQPLRRSYLPGNDTSSRSRSDSCLFQTVAGVRQAPRSIRGPPFGQLDEGSQRQESRHSI